MMVQTEIGLLPEDWEVETLENIGSFTKGSGISRSDSLSGRIPAVRYGELYTDHDNYIKTFHSFISPEVAKTSRKMKQGCILFTASGETKEDIGKAVAFLDDFEAYAGGDLIILNPKGDYSSQYLGYTLNSPSSVRQKAMMAQGDSVVHITTGSVQKVTVPIPSSTEQQNIASALSSIDKLIDDLGRTIQKKQRIREGAMEELLSGKKRLPGFTEEWVEKPISYFGSFKGQTINPSATPNEMFSEYSMPAYDEGMKPFQAKGSDMLSSRTQIEGEVLLVNKLNVRQRRIWHIYNCEDNAICSGEFLPFKSTVIALDYLKQLLLTEKVVNDFIDLSTGTSNSQKRVTPKQILDYQITVPSDIHEQHAIADILTSMDDEISLLESERAKYEQIRSGMMEELLTGKKRLTNSTK